ncbi:DUF1624 domain-containing protein [Dyadobacter luticola]|uniref:DUF1624 domain-containing protein n=1 Tax=Dyadobacter luticola TaxID=1979387 RepID=A0A5R9L2Y7_9BACT|nr:heparan-alpha-glucosaminide N-acetyltransferase domain-containing protein [Dyadobacter luticola]TLV02926.1 DUF1624 domain-containing protein [Dyadobacter luticola]
MPNLTPSRIQSIDLLKGFVMVLMALDHTRDYFFQAGSFFEVSNPAQAAVPVFITRIITHVCAPTFSFLAGVSAYMSGKKKSKAELAEFLVKRGLWLILMELTIITFAWYLNVAFNSIDLAVIWVLGASMVFLAGFIFLPPNVILIISVVLIAGHNLLDNIHLNNVWWAMLHEVYATKIFGGHTTFSIIYPIIPWIGVMSLGYYVGRFYDNSILPAQRRKWFNRIGFSSFALFIIIRWLNVYGDPVPWVHMPTTGRTLMSFLNVTKYPPSLCYLLFTLTFTFLFLANSEKWRGRLVDFFSVFGRVPFFYYILHLYLIRIASGVAGWLTGHGWDLLVQKDFEIDLHGFGFSLPAVYLIWMCIIVALYPVCKRFDRYKQSHREQWWLSYL